MAVTGQFAALDEDLTGYENLTVLARLHGLPRAAGKQRADDLLAAFAQPRRRRGPGLMNNAGGAAGSVAWSLIATAAIAAVCAPLALHLYNKRG